MGLRNALRNWRPPLFSLPARPVAMERAEREVEKLLGAGPAVSPEPFELDAIYRALVQAHAAQGSIRGVGGKMLRQAPWVLFSHPSERPGHLAAAPDIARDYAAWLGEQRQRRPLHAALHAFLLHYPDSLPTFSFWLATLRERLFADGSPRLHPWRESCRAFGLLAEDGPERLWRKLASETSSVSEVLAAAGLDGALGTGRFAETAFRGLLHHVADLLDKGRADAPLERLIAFAAPVDQGMQVRFRFSLTREIAEGLLMPFARKRAVLSYKERLRTFLVERIGDPRWVTSGWQGVRQEARDVLLGWLVENSLQDFFRILTATADPIWTFRRDFWEGYLKKGVISEAWVVLGRDARNRAADAFEGQYGSLTGATGTQSVLLMRIGGLTIAEWSHSGACRIWLTPTGLTPKFYLPSYSADDLRETSDEWIPHHHSDRHTWQGRVARYIKDHTGITWP